MAIAASPFGFGSEPSQAALLKQAKVSEAQARGIALQHVPDGRIRSSELEREGGRLIWSFDIARPKTRDITEIQVDARSGKMVMQQLETPKQQAAEKRAEK